MRAAHTAAPRPTALGRRATGRGPTTPTPAPARALESPTCHDVAVLKVRPVPHIHEQQRCHKLRLVISAVDHAARLPARSRPSFGTNATCSAIHSGSRDLCLHEQLVQLGNGQASKRFVHSLQNSTAGCDEGGGNGTAPWESSSAVARDQRAGDSAAWRGRSVAPGFARALVIDAPVSREDCTLS